MKSKKMKVSIKVMAAMLVASAGIFVVAAPAHAAELSDVDIETQSIVDDEAQAPEETSYTEEDKYEENETLSEEESQVSEEEKRDENEAISEEEPQTGDEETFEERGDLIEEEPQVVDEETFEERGDLIEEEPQVVDEETFEERGDLIEEEPQVVDEESLEERGDLISEECPQVGQGTNNIVVLKAETSDSKDEWKELMDELEVQDKDKNPATKIVESVNKYLNVVPGCCTDTIKQAIDKADFMGDAEKDLTKNVTTKVINSLAGDLLSIMPGGGLVKRGPKLLEAALKVYDAPTTSSKIYNSLKCANAAVDTAISVVPGGGFIVTAKGIAEDVLMYGARKLFSLFG